MKFQVHEQHWAESDQAREWEQESRARQSRVEQSIVGKCQPIPMERSQERAASEGRRERLEMERRREREVTHGMMRSCKKDQSPFASSRLSAS